MTLPPTAGSRLALASLSIFLMGTPFAAFVGLAPQIEREWTLGPSASAGLYSAYLLGAALAAAVLLPRIRGNSIRAMLSAALLMAVAHLSFVVTPGPMWAAMARIVAGGAYLVAYYGAIQWVAARTPAERRGRSIGALVAAGYGGTSASYLLVAAVLNAGLDWRQGYALLSLPAFGGFLAAWLAFRNSLDSQSETPPVASVRPARARSLSTNQLALTIAGYGVHSAELFVARFWVPYAVLGLLNAGTQGGSGTQAYLLVGLMFSVGIPSPFLGGWLADHIGTGRATAGVLGIGAILAFALPWVGHPLLFLVLVLVYCFILPADSAVFTAEVTRLAPPSHLGKAQAFQAVVGFAAGALFPAAVGLIVEFAEGTTPWKVALLSNGVLALAGVWIVRRLPDGTVEQRSL